MDITTALLNGEMKEQVYMKQPEDMLRRSIYGLKQSLRCWNVALDSQLNRMGFTQTTGDPCLYVSTEGEPFIVAVYVDDALLAGKSDRRIKEVKCALSSQFNVKDMGELEYFFGVKVVQDIPGGTIWMGQPSYTETIMRVQYGRCESDEHPGESKCETK